MVTLPGMAPPGQEQILQAFFQDKDQHPPHAIYRQAESGAIGTVEPKESWQVSISNLGLDNLDNLDSNKETSRISGWCRALQQVAFQVEQALDLPPHLLLDANPTTSLDLMRVFYYHAVNQNHNQNQENPILGSSPHTDWGSLTVVWQDEVGGLQTYCHACQTYRHVTPSPKSTTTENGETEPVWNCIVHVGDVTSLALAAAAAATESDDSSSIHQHPRQWPSPKHRVVSQDRLRTSLVYFAYPPPHLSLQDVTSALVQWAPASDSDSHTTTTTTTKLLPVPLPVPLPLNEYYLLKNQSTESDVTAATVLQSIQHQPLGEVFLQKWNQVQR
jgi:hypothetical protein